MSELRQDLMVGFTRCQYCGGTHVNGCPQNPSRLRSMSHEAPRIEDMPSPDQQRANRSRLRLMLYPSVREVNYLNMIDTARREAEIENNRRDDAAYKDAVILAAVGQAAKRYTIPPREPAPEPFAVNPRLKIPPPRVLSAIQLRQVTMAPTASMKTIMREVSVFFQMPLDHILSGSHRRRYVWPRQITMAACCNFLPKLSMPEIGLRLGNYDHTTILHARDKIAKLRQWMGPDGREADAVFKAIAWALVPAVVVEGEAARELAEAQVAAE